MFTIGLGYEGATDSCLTLTYNGQTKQYGVESVAWNILSVLWEAGKREIPLDSVLGKVLWVVLEQCDDDMFDDAEA